ncbi:MAG: tRNA uridine(34) 5-carboxymethylaminomethyl modification radical SAM/GNAT enzyme Elp3 [Parcubacteria group bacterium]
MDILKATIKDLTKSKLKNSDDLARAKRRLSKKYKMPLFSNVVLLKRYHELVKNEKIKELNSLKLLLRTRPVRSLSGIVNISVLTKPYPCPGKCLFCPQELGIPKSYVSGEPAVERAKALKYDPYLQVKRRIEMLENEGHPTDKIELRIAGGTWSYYPERYQKWFIKKCFDACSEKSKIKNQKSKLQFKIQNLRETQKQNEKTSHRIIGLSVETRPDFINLTEIKKLREFGTTLVELGVQSVYDDVLKLNLRGHGRQEIILATKLLKNAGFKVLYQMMPNLPGSDLKRDEKMFEELFKNPDFKPDALKIYPCALLKNAPLYKLWKSGKYKPYTEPQLVGLIKNIKKKIPHYVRIQRITRDIPSKSIIAGPAKISNLRQLLFQDMKKENWQCNCVRCREVKGGYDTKEKIYLFRQDYEASAGKEIFLSFENKNRKKLYSLLRLRINEDSAIIREIHTYGQLVPISKKQVAAQHQGLGKKLIQESEKIIKKEFKLKKITVISGIGARDYFRKLGYSLKETYMIKNP